MKKGFSILIALLLTLGTFQIPITTVKAEEPINEVEGDDSSNNNSETKEKEESSNDGTDDLSNQNNNDNIDSEDKEDENSGDTDITEQSPKIVESINDNWTFNEDGIDQQVNLPHCWEYVHPTMSYIPAMNKKTCTYTKTIDISKFKDKNLFLRFNASNKNTVLMLMIKK